MKYRIGRPWKQGSPKKNIITVIFFQFQCEPVTGLGFRRGSYRCLCKIGYYFPQVESKAKYFNGTTLEEEYARILEVKLFGMLFLYFFCLF